MGFGRMTFQNGLPQYLIQLDISNLLCCRIAVSDPILIIDKKDPLLHGGEDSFQNG
jgi:hypothetical protein